MTVHHCLFIESIGSKVRRVSVGRYTLTFNPRLGSSWIPALGLFIEAQPNPRKVVEPLTWDVIIVRRKA